ncbi:hypothetical protein HS088_TW13G00626 [Tripterygium wilfordii]|uniref:Uncharacterized protein n=1 Tax=Tripterygium wilfordii TaxID=458696 RepID=A0A7J7CUG5_TRIWF|nr:hypothetical protein HS088_TW13G00626 [Tripterygium wilfordii]
MKQFLLVIVAAVASTLLLISPICESARDGFAKPKHVIVKPRVHETLRYAARALNSETMMKEDNNNNVVVDNEVEVEEEDGGRNLGEFRARSGVHGSDSGHAHHGGD